MLFIALPKSVFLFKFYLLNIMSAFKDLHTFTLFIMYTT